MRSEPGMSRKQADDLLSLMGDDKEMRRKMAGVLRSELAGSGHRVDAARDVGRLRR